MTKIGEETVLTSECVSRLSRLPVVSGGDFVFVNTSSNSISSIIASDHKLVQTWTLAHPNIFTCPVTFSHEENKVCCVSDYDTLLIWTDTTSSLKKSVKLKLPSKVFTLLSLPGSGCFSVFESGVVLPVDKIMLDPQLVTTAPKPNLNGDLVWADVLFDVHSQETLFAFVTSERKKHQLWCFRLVRDGWTLDLVCSYNLTKENLELCSWCMGWSAKTPVFIAAWNTGEIESYPLKGNQPSVLFRLSNVTSNCVIAVESLDKSHLAIVIKRKDTTAIEVWDSKYGTQKASGVIKHTLAKNFQMRAVGSKLCVSISSGVMAIPVELEESTLFAVVGKTSQQCQSICYEWDASGKVQELGKEKLSIEATKPMDFTSMSLNLLEKKLGLFTQAEMIQLCSGLSKQKEIVEKDLVRLVQFALQRSEGLKFTKITEDGALFENRDFLLLCSVFSIRFSDVFLQHSLNALSSEETRLALQFLIFLMDKRVFTGEDDVVPNDLQIANWIQLLIQSHFEDLLMSTDLEQLVLLKQLRICVSDKLEVYEELNEISNLLKFSQRKNLLPESYTGTEYSVDVIKY